MRSRFALTVVASLIVAVGAGAIASAQPGGRAHGPQPFTVSQVTSQQRFLPADAGSSELALGDRLVFSSTLSGAKRGTDGGVCTVTNVIDAPAFTGIYHCSVTAEFADGQITGQALVRSTAGNNPPRFAIAVTGGTGAYAGASGHVAVETISRGRANLTFWLKP
jgi:hypothetical protein